MVLRDQRLSETLFRDPDVWGSQGSGMTEGMIEKTEQENSSGMMVLMMMREEE